MFPRRGNVPWGIVDSNTRVREKKNERMVLQYVWRDVMVRKFQLNLKWVIMINLREHKFRARLTNTRLATQYILWTARRSTDIKHEHITCWLPTNIHKNNRRHILTGNVLFWPLSHGTRAQLLCYAFGLLSYAST